MRERKYALNFVHSRAGLSAQQVRWAREIYEWWQNEGPLSEMPREPFNIAREPRGARWRRDQKGWAEEAIAARKLKSAVRASVK